MPRTLRIAMSGDDVQVLQKVLNARLGVGLGFLPKPGFTPLAIDGKFGPITQQCVIKFQQKSVLNVDGVVGPLTWGKLLRHPVRSTTGFCVLERHLFDAGGTRIIPRGINVPVLDHWRFPDDSSYVDELLDRVADTGANAVRIPWYITYPVEDRPGYEAGDLDYLLFRCRSKQMFAIVVIHDTTCLELNDQLENEVVPWWKSHAAMLNQHEKSLIVNPANELGFYEWPGLGTPKQRLDKFQAKYTSAIAGIREELHVPILIDAPDGGARLDVWNDIGRTLIQKDPEYNLMLSTHAYWAEEDWTAELDTTIDARLPIVFGEIANKQFDEKGDSPEDAQCYWGLDGSGIRHPPRSGFDYANLLATLQEKEVGWLAWGWGPDGCPDRQIAQLDPDGTFRAYTPYGEDIVNNPTYGLKATAVRSIHLA